MIKTIAILFGVIFSIGNAAAAYPSKYLCQEDDPDLPAETPANTLLIDFHRPEIIENTIVPTEDGNFAVTRVPVIDATHPEPQTYCRVNAHWSDETYSLSYQCSVHSIYIYLDRKTNRGNVEITAVQPTAAEITRTIPLKGCTALQP